MRRAAALLVLTLAVACAPPPEAPPEPPPGARPPTPALAPEAAFAGAKARPLSRPRVMRSATPTGPEPPDAARLARLRARAEALRARPGG